MPIRSVQFVGTSARELRTPRTEHNRFGITGGAPLERSLSEILEPLDWTEAVFTDLAENSRDLAALNAIAEKNNWGFRMTAADDGYAISTDDSFERYLSSLGSNTRLRLFNRRKLFESLGEVREENLWPDHRDAFFAALNDFHRARWGKTCFGEKSLAFNRKFLARVEAEGGEPVLSGLFCGGRLVSVLYNVWFEGVTYNIQAGFEEGFHKKLALGYLHLGYAIEKAFQCAYTQRFDLLAGHGKSEDYKARLATDAYRLISVMLVRSTVFRALYWIKGLNKPVKECHDDHPAPD